jgi:hypothetical protein
MLRKLRLSGILLILGLLVEALSLCWNNAVSFMSFVSNWRPAVRLRHSAIPLFARFLQDLRSQQLDADVEALRSGLPIIRLSFLTGRPAR